MRIQRPVDRLVHIVAKLLALLHVRAESQHVAPRRVLLGNRVENRLLSRQLILLLLGQLVDAFQDILLFPQFFVDHRRQTFDTLRVPGGGLRVLGDLLSQFR